MNTKKIPESKRTEYWKKKSLRRKGAWRRPRGKHNKLREQIKSKGVKLPRIGYGADKRYKYMHPSGYREVLIKNMKELEKVNPEKEAVRISAKLGKRKKEEIRKKAEELKIKVLN